MPDHPDLPDPADEARVRAALAADPPPAMPADVAARLQSVIAGEARERAAALEPTPDDRSTDGVVVPLRRRRWVAGLAAAAVTLGVVGIGATVIDDVLGGSGDDQSAGSAADDAGAQRAESSEEEPESAGELPAPTLNGGPQTAAAVRFDSERVDAQLARVADGLLASTLYSETLRTPATPRCLTAGLPPQVGRTPSVPATLDGRPATVVVDPADPSTDPAGRATAALYVCTADGAPRVVARTPITAD